MENKSIFKNKYDKAAEQFYQAVGQQANYSKVYNCMTRLRFIIVNKELVNIDEIKKNALVKGINWNGNELQIIIGGEVQKVKDAFDKFLKNQSFQVVENNLELTQNNNANTTVKKSWKARIMGALSGIMVPTLPVFIAVGMLMGVKSIFIATGLMPEIKGSTDLATIEVGWAVFYAVTEIAFKMLGIFIGYNTMKYLGGNTVMSLLLGIAIANPFFFNGTHWEIADLGNGFSFKIQAFTNSVLPHIAANVAYFYFERWIKTWMPSMVDIIFRPLLAYSVVIFATYFLVGPVLFMVEQSLGIAINWIGNIPYGFGVAIFALVWQPLVVTGMHVAVATPIMVQLMGGTPQALLPALMIAVYGQVGAMIGVIIMTKNAQLRKVGIANLVPGFIGITEPIIYGINLPKLKPFLSGMFGAAVGGLFSGAIGVKLMTQGGYGIFEVTGYIPGGALNIAFWATSLLISLVASLGFSLLLYRERISEKNQVIKTNRKLVALYAKVKNVNYIQAKNELQETLASMSNVDEDILKFIKELEKNYIKMLKLKVQLDNHEEKTANKFDKLTKKYNEINEKHDKKVVKLSANLDKQDQLKVENDKFNQLTNNLEQQIEALQVVNPAIKKIEAEYEAIKKQNEIDSQQLTNWQNDKMNQVQEVLTTLKNQTGFEQFNSLENDYFNAYHSLDINYQITNAKDRLYNRQVKQQVKKAQLLLK